MDVRHAEFGAMADVFLGVDYDPVKLRQVEDLQVALHQRQAELSRRHDQGEISDEEYVDAANAAINDTFRECQTILGPEDFCKLFGSSPNEGVGLIDRAAFQSSTR